MTIVENETGDVYEYTESNNLISRNDIVLSSEQVLPVFSKDEEGRPMFCGIHFLTNDRFLSLSGNLNKLT